MQISWKWSARKGKVNTGEGEEGSAGPQPLDAVAGADSQIESMAQRVRVFSLLFYLSGEY